MKSQIHLIRHGITEGNQRRLYYGAADIPLAPEGKTQLEQLVKAGIYPQVEDGDFYTTGLLRTEQTFSIIFGDREHQCINELKEMNFGDFEMKHYEELKELPEYIEWISDKTGQLTSPGGESITGFTDRISQGLKILMGKHRLRELSVRHCGEDAISTVVCHGGTIGSIMETCFSGRQEHFFKWVPDPGHGYTLNLVESDIVSYDEF